MSDESGSTPLGDVFQGVNSHDLQGESLLRNETQPAVEAKADGPAEPATQTQEQQAQQPEQASEDGGQRHPDGYVPLKALEAIRKEKQELRQELAFLKGQLSRPEPQQQHQAQEGEEEIDYYGSPEKWTDQRIDQRLKGVEERVSWDARVASSQAIMRMQHEDYNEVEQVFLEAAKDNPGLQQQLRAHPAPALFAYNMGKTLQEMDGVKDIGDLRAKIEAEVRAKIEAEVKSKNAVSSAANATTSSAGANSSAVTSPAFTGPTSLSDIFPGAGV